MCIAKHETYIEFQILSILFYSLVLYKLFICTFPRKRHQVLNSRLNGKGLFAHTIQVAMHTQYKSQCIILSNCTIVRASQLLLMQMCSKKSCWDSFSEWWSEWGGSHGQFECNQWASPGNRQQTLGPHILIWPIASGFHTNPPSGFWMNDVGKRVTPWHVQILQILDRSAKWVQGISSEAHARLLKSRIIIILLTFEALHRARILATSICPHQICLLLWWRYLHVITCLAKFFCCDPDPTYWALYSIF